MFPFMLHNLVSQKLCYQELTERDLTVTAHFHSYLSIDNQEKNRDSSDIYGISPTLYS